MEIRFEKLSDWQRWPITSTRFLFPCVAIKGFKGNYRFFFAFWKWRKDVSIQYNATDQARRGSAAPLPASTCCASSIDGEPDSSELMDDIRETSRQLEITTRHLAHLRLALKDPVAVHAMMLRGEVAWDAAKIRHLLGNEDLLDMLYRCEAWFSTLPEGRKMQLECQRIIDMHNSEPSR